MLPDLNKMMMMIIITALRRRLSIDEWVDFYLLSYYFNLLNYDY